MLFQILGTVRTKVRLVLFLTLIISLSLFSTFVYYQYTSKKVSRLTRSQAQVKSYSVYEQITKRLKTFDFGKAKKSLLDNQNFLGNVLGYKELEETITQAQSLPKYTQLLQVIKNKNKKFQTYISSKSSSIDKQLTDLDQKLQYHIAYAQKDNNFHRFIKGRFDKVKRISRNTSLRRSVQKEVDAYLLTFEKELKLLDQVVGAKKETLGLSARFEKEFSRLARNLSSVIAHKNKIVTYVEYGVLAIMVITTLSLLCLIALSFSATKGIFKSINKETEQWLVDYSQALMEKSFLELKGASSNFQNKISQIINRHSEVRTIGELVENRFPFPVILTSQQGDIEWGNRYYLDMTEGMIAHKVSDLWKTQDEIIMGEEQLEGVCEYKAEPGKQFEYIVVPMRKHQKYFMIFTPMARVEKSQNKLMQQYSEPLAEALNGILSHQFQMKSYDWKQFPRIVQDLLTQISSIHSMIQTERSSSEKSLQKLIEKNQTHERTQESLQVVNQDIAARIDHYRDGIAKIKNLYLEMVDKQDRASQILVNSVDRHEELSTFLNHYSSDVKVLVESSSSAIEKFENIFSNSLSEDELRDVRFSKMKLYLEETMKSIHSLQVINEKSYQSIQENDSMKSQYQKLSQELAQVDKDFIEMISSLYQDIMHLHYRVNGHHRGKKPRPTELV